MSERIQRRQQRTRDHLADVAHRLFEREEYGAVTMDQIAVEADVARGTLYNHFPVKEALVVHWVNGQLANDLGGLMQEALAQPTFAARLRAIWTASGDWWERHRGYAAPYIRYRFQQVGGGSADEAGSDMIAVYGQLIDAAQQAGELAADQSAARVAWYLHYLYLAALMEWLAAESVSLPEALGRAADFFFKGAAPR